MITIKDLTKKSNEIQTIFCDFKVRLDETDDKR